MNKQEIIKYIILRTIGNFLLLFALFGVGATFGPAIYFEIHFRLDQINGVHYIISSSSKSAVEKPQSLPKASVANEQPLTPIDTSFGIVIPKLGANAKIYPNIDVNNEAGFLPILQKGIAHAKGTVFPGMNGNIYLFAHSTDNFWDVGRYNAVFYLLKDLQQGDDIAVFYNGIRYDYSVSESKIVDSSDTSYISNAQSSLKRGNTRADEKLIMQTCWPPGTTWKRLLVIAKPK